MADLTLTANVQDSVASSAGANSGIVVSTSIVEAVEITAAIVTGAKGEKGDPGQQGIPGTNGIDGINGTGGNLTTGVPNELPNGVRTVFTVPVTYVLGSLQVFLNGLKESFVSQSSTTTLTFETAPITGDKIELLYRVP